MTISDVRPTGVAKPDDDEEAALPAEVNLSQIGRMAGVGRAAVVNWRRRHGDFPPAVGGTAESPTFDREAVAAWLTGRGWSVWWGVSEETPQE